MTTSFRRWGTEAIKGSRTDLLRIAGDAACLLEDMGFAAVARRKDGLVTLELWSPIGPDQRALRRVVSETDTDAQQLAETCAADYDHVNVLH